LLDALLQLVIEAAFWGFVGGFALLVGSAIGLFANASRRTIGLVMAFGAGVLISAVAFELTEEAFRRGGTDAVAIGLACGAVSFFAGDWVIDHRGGNHRKRSQGEQKEGSGGAIVVGAMLDGIPESIAIGASLLGHGAVGFPVVAAVFLSNVPESLSAATGLQTAGRSTRWILGLWLGVALICAAASAAGYAFLGGASENVIGFIESFAAGAILTMLADTMMPESFADAGAYVGLVTVLGFALAFFLSNVG
jgi:ZIP family zinc transporter